MGCVDDIVYNILLLPNYFATCNFYLFYFDRSDEVQAIVSGKLALKYSGPAVEAMKSIATASHKRSLAEFQKVFSQIPESLTNFMWGHFPENSRRHFLFSKQGSK